MSDIWAEHVRAVTMASRVLAEHDPNTDLAVVANAIRQLDAALQCMVADMAARAAQAR